MLENYIDRVICFKAITWLRHGTGSVGKANIMKLEGKTILVTGAASGLGRATALACAKEGGSLFLVDRDREGLASTQAKLRETGVTAESFVRDLVERQACFDAVAAAVKRFGQLDALCNIAGIMQFHEVTKVSPDDWNKIIATNLSAPFYLSQAAIPELLKSHGSIVNVASAAGIGGTAYAVPYSVTKAGLIQMTKSMAMEYIRHPIRINALAPGSMDTEMNVNLLAQGGIPGGLDRSLIERYSGFRPFADPTGMANMIVHMLSDETPALHGSVVSVDAGMTAG
jgi:meso-butanediol dehydrogenase/(S,S)-butanediol dehydrogenase/diacetyl reductase